jgi:WG containing repeat
LVNPGKGLPYYIAYTNSGKEIWSVSGRKILDFGLGSYYLGGGYLFLEYSDSTEVYWCPRFPLKIGRFRKPQYLGNNRFIAWSGTGFKVYNNSGLAISDSYNTIESTNFGFIKVTLSGFNGLIDSAGNTVFGCVFQQLQVTGSQSVLVESENQFALLDLEGNEIIAFQPDTLHLRPDGLIESRNCGVKAVYAADGCSMLPPNCVSTGMLSAGLLIGRSVQGWHIADNQGQLWLTNYRRADKIYPFSGSLALAKIDGMYGFLDKEGYVRISNRYQEGKNFSEGLAAVRLGKKWACINLADQLVVQPWYGYIGPFCKGLAVFSREKQWGLLNNEGKEITFGFDSLAEAATGGYYCYKTGQVGYYNAEGNQVLFTKFDSIFKQLFGNFKVKRQGKWGAYSRNGTVIVPVLKSYLEVNPFDGSFVVLP